MRPLLSILDDELAGRIIDEAMSLLATTGVRIDDSEAFARLTQAGLPGDRETDRITFPHSALEGAVAAAPQAVSLFDRNGDHRVELAGEAVHFGPGSSALRILDHRTGAVRAANTSDLVEFVKVADGLRHVAYMSTAFVAGDVPQEIADAWRLYVVLAHSAQPVVTGAFSAGGFAPMVRIMELLRGGRRELAERPLAVFTCCPNTPLHWGRDSIHNLIDCADARVPVEVVPVVQLGLNAPVTTVGALVMHTAEVLSGIAITQTINPGSPVLFGGAPASFHMQYTTSPMSAVEAMKISCAYAQIAKRLSLPSQAFMGLSDAKANDAQAGAETGTGAMLAGLAGVNSVAGLGMLDYVNCFSLEKLVLDAEIAGQVQHFVRPTTIAGDLPMNDIIDELLTEQHLLTAPHTLERWQSELYLPGPMYDRMNWDQWREGGEKQLRERALDQVEGLLRSYDAAPLCDEIHREVRDELSSICAARISLPDF